MVRRQLRQISPATRALAPERCAILRSAILNALLLRSRAAVLARAAGAVGLVVSVEVAALQDAFASGGGGGGGFCGYSGGSASGLAGKGRISVL